MRWHAGIAVSYLTRVLRLTLLAQDIVELILDGTQEPDRTLSQLLAPLPTDWQSQRCVMKENHRSAQANRFRGALSRCEGGAYLTSSSSLSKRPRNLVSSSS